MESEWVSVFDEFVDEEEFVVAVDVDDDDDCVSWLFVSSEGDVPHSTPACVAWTSDSLVESKWFLINQSWNNSHLTYDWSMVKLNSALLIV